MKFKYSVIGDNTQENREWLEKLGNKFNFVVSYVEFDIIYTWKGEMFFIDKIDVKNLEPSLFINCIGNPQLFQAVSAIRDGTDINQLFVDEMLELLTGEINLIMCERDDKKYLEVYTTLRKATLTELQERFKID